MLDNANKSCIIWLRLRLISLANSISGNRMEAIVMCKDSCKHPDKLKTKPSECNPEQIKECHGETGKHTCEDSCENPDRLKTKPSECSPEQIRECHGDAEGHPC